MLKGLALCMLLLIPAQARAGASRHEHMLPDPQAQQLNWWGVNVLFSGVQLSGLAEWLTDANTGGLGSTVTKVFSALVGGMPVPGTLTLKADGIHFKVDSLLQTLMFRNLVVSEFFIPKKDIVSATATPSFLGMSVSLLGPNVKVRTVKGDLTVTSQWSSDSIASSINALVQQHR